MFLIVSFTLMIPMQTNAPVKLDDSSRAKLQEIAFQAARNDDPKTLKEYFGSGFDVNQTNQRGDTLLTVAAYAGSAKAVDEILTQKELKIDQRNRMGLTALAAAAFKGHAAIAAKLIAKGADVHAANGVGQTALMFAALAGKTEVARVLLDHGAKADAVDKLGNSAFGLAKAQGAKEMVALLEGALRKK